LLTSSSGFLQDDHFDVVSDIGSPVLFFSHSIGQSNYVPVSTRLSTSESISPSISVLTGSPSMSTKITPTFDQPSAVNNSSLVSCLPRWDAKTIEVVGLMLVMSPLDDKIRSQKKHVSIVLMTHVLETFDPISYLDAQG
jgi:hypothetical protein